MPQPPLPLSWASTLVPDIPDMTPGLLQAGDSGSVASTEIPRGPTPIESNLGGGQQQENWFPTSLDNNQSPLNANLYETDSAGDLNVPAATQQTNGFSNQLPNDGGPSANLAPYGGPTGMTNIEQHPYGSVFQWQNPTQAPFHAPHFANGGVAPSMMHPPHCYAHMPFFYGVPNLTSPYLLAQPNQTFNTIPLEQSTLNAGTPQMQSARPRQYGHFPQSVPLPAVSNHRRVHRAPSVSSTSGHQASRVRPVNGTNAAQAQRNRAAMMAASDLIQVPGVGLYCPPQAGEYTRRNRGSISAASIARQARPGQPVSAHQGHHSRYHRPRSEYQGLPCQPTLSLDSGKDGRPEPKESEELIMNMECKVCYAQPVDTVALPCGHAILCRWCAETTMPASRTDRNRITTKSDVRCPMCRCIVKQKWRIYLS